MTYQDKLVRFCKRKFNLLDASWAFTEEDEKEILQWGDETISQIIDKMSNDNDNLFCPWCVKHRYIEPTTGCDNCTYAKRHGDCRNEDSAYKKIQQRSMPTLPFVTYLSVTAPVLLKELKQ